ncbi:MULTISPECIES: lysozyme [unclassified Sphingomonas]|uniref:lysozyme n=1 Tax=unclassified Sphingomonas TaxID=196159 RepID=UPI00226A0A69|nr:MULTISPECIES: lysozyme [unclassified Sphingomonas]
MIDVAKPPRPGAAPNPRVPSGSAVAGGSAAAAIAAALALAVAGLKPDEGKRNVDYLDMVKVPTACYGHTGPDVKVGTRRTDAQCETLLTKDAQEHLNGVLRCTPVLATHPNQLAAATRITFNIGVGGYCGSSIADRFNRGDWQRACDRFLVWNKAGGKVVPGLTARRQRERAQCLIQLPA